MHALSRTSDRRPGFTLVEMLVVLSIVVMLAALTALFMPRIQERQRAAKGADQLQGWLLIAKQWAMRDRVPTGIRILQQRSIDAPNPGSFLVRDLQYIQQPDFFSQGRLINAEPMPDPARGYRCTFLNADFIGGGLAQAGQADQAPVQVGDHLEVYGGGLIHPITFVPNRDSFSSTPPQLYVGTPVAFGPPSSTTSGASYRILRQPRLVAGEPTLKLPQDVVVDVSLAKNVPVRTVNEFNPTTGQLSQTVGFWEVLFSPGGALVGAGTLGNPIVLWVRDASQDPNKPGQQTLMTINTRTGQIAAHPVANGPDPYLYTHDGRSSGL